MARVCRLFILSQIFKDGSMVSSYNLLRFLYHDQHYPRHFFKNYTPAWASPPWECMEFKVLTSSSISTYQMIHLKFCWTMVVLMVETVNQMRHTSIQAPTALILCCANPIFEYILPWAEQKWRSPSLIQPLRYLQNEMKQSHTYCEAIWTENQNCECAYLLL